LTFVDTDSLASSIAYATLNSKLANKRSIPLILTPSTLVNLRPENQLALSLAQIPESCLMYIDQLPLPTAELAVMDFKFALVDHNSLLAQFHPHPEAAGMDDPVEAIIDHHADDQMHKGASPRIIQVPTGSTSSLVAMHFAPKWEVVLDKDQAEEDSVPRELASLLLTAALIDTGGLKPGEGSKTTETDRQAGEFLWKIAGKDLSELFPDSSALSGSTPTVEVSAESLKQGSIPTSLKGLTDELFAAKFDVTGLSSRELLMRDYKEYSLHTSLDNKEVKVGLSTVPLGLGNWLSRERGQDQGWEGLLEAVDDWMLERGLDVSGVLTTFRETATEEREKGKGRREIFLIVRTSDDSVLSSAEAERLFKTLQKGMIDAEEVLELKSWPGKKAGATLRKELKDLSLVRGDGEAGKSKVNRWGDVWRQGNTSSTRKQVQPLMVSWKIVSRTKRHNTAC
jgi:exopolyphosphatase